MTIRALNMSDIQNVAFCPHCGNTAPQRLAYQHTYVTTGYALDDESRIQDGPPCTYYVAICSTCEEILLYHSICGVVSDEHFTRAALLYPKSGELHESVPAPVRGSYSEAARIRNVAPNAYAVMVRRALEAICDDRGIPPGSLHKRLEELVGRGEIPPRLAEMSAVLRILGNTGAHSAPKSVTVPMTWAMDEFFRAIVEYVYVAPSKIAEFSKRLQREH
jgi:hypothetical protein